MSEVTGFSLGYLSRMNTGSKRLSRSFIDRCCFALNEPENKLFLPEAVAAAASSQVHKKQKLNRKLIRPKQEEHKGKETEMKSESGNSKYKERLTHCSLCGDSTGINKMQHLAKRHPEYKFTSKRSDKYKSIHTVYYCGFCPTELLSIKDMIVHIDSKHELELEAGRATGIPAKELNLPRTPEESPMKETVILDNFFGGLGSSLQELNVLRTEKAAWEKERSELQKQMAEWEKKAKRWCEQVVNLQQEISKPDR